MVEWIEQRRGTILFAVIALALAGLTLFQSLRSNPEPDLLPPAGGISACMLDGFLKKFLDPACPGVQLHHPERTPVITKGHTLIGKSARFLT